MKNIAVIVCNYNKKEYIIKCLESLQRQTVTYFDIYVVDNASTDESVQEIQHIYGDKLTLICNDENLGGSGGFNSGINEAYDKGYKYFVLLDNDVVLQEDFISVLFNDMEENTDVGIMGAKILKMDMPDIIQEIAPKIDYTNLTFVLNYAGESDSLPLPHLIECDYVPACALIIRRDVIDKIGCLPENNYIYYDDIIWCTRCRRIGYSVMSNTYAKVWHKGGAAINSTTFGNYYLIRNKTIFFMSNADLFDNKEKMSVNSITEIIIREIFEGIYSCFSNGLIGIAKTRFDAFIDALTGLMGKADAYKIRKRENPKERIELLLHGKRKILIYMYDQFENTRRILGDIRNYEINNNERINVQLVSDIEHSYSDIMGYSIIRSCEVEEGDYELTLHVCAHIYELNIDSLDRIWIDGWSNILSNCIDLERKQKFESVYEMFRVCFFDRVRDRIQQLTNEEISLYGAFPLGNK